MAENRFVVIMAGGKGERFWPQSRLKRPKHLLPIVGEKPMLRQTVDRLDGFIAPENILIITNSEQIDAVRETCEQLPHDNIIGEPVGRDTAPAVGLAATLVDRKSPGATFAILPADHVVEDEDAFRKTLAKAFTVAEDTSAIVTVGIEPAYAATGYGYIRKGEQLTQEVYKVSQFKEKPDEKTAKSYLDSGDYYWNAGMFIWKSTTVLTEMQKHAPELAAALLSIRQQLDKGTALQPTLEKEYPDLDKISIDYAVMEKATDVYVVTSQFDWDDVGEWPAIERHFEADDAGNICRGETACHEAYNNIIVSDDKNHLIALVGCDDLIVVKTEDATLICKKDQAQNIKNLVKQLGQHDKWKKLM